MGLLWLDCVWWVRQLPPFLDTPVASPPPETLGSPPSELKLTLCERFEKAGRMWGLRAGGVANHRAEFSLNPCLAEPTSLAFGPWHCQPALPMAES